MEGTGLPLVTPFDSRGAVDEERLADLVRWVEARGVDFIAPCGSNSEAELMSVEERARVVEVVVEAAEGPVLAGTGHPGLEETRRQTALAADAGAEAALVVTPFYFSHDQETLAAYYRELADGSDLPIYLYSVPAFTGTAIEPETVAALADHDNVAGIKDSSGSLENLQRIVSRVDDDFEVIVGSGSVYAYALAAGVVGGVMALANVAPAETSEVLEHVGNGDFETASERNAGLVELNYATTKKYGIPGLKAAMRMRGAPAGHVRSPHRPLDEGALEELRAIVDAVERR